MNPLCLSVRDPEVLVQLPSASNLMNAASPLFGGKNSAFAGDSALKIPMENSLRVKARSLTR